MRRFRRYIAAFVLAFGLSAVPAQAWIFHDGPAFLQRMLQLIQVLQQWNQVIRTTNQQLAAVKAAYAGLKDWKNFGWMDTLRLADSPWFDGIEGIDEIRQYTNVTIMSAQQAQDLFNNVENLKKLINDKRYKTDPWYRWRVNAMLRQSQQAQKVKAALLLQMKAANKDLMANVGKLKELHNKIQIASMASPADSATIAACQAEIAAIEAKYHGESIVLKNQQAIMFLVGEKDMLKAYQNQMDRTNQLESADVAKGITKSLRRRS